MNAEALGSVEVARLHGLLLVGLLLCDLRRFLRGERASGRCPCFREIPVGFALDCLVVIVNRLWLATFGKDTCVPHAIVVFVDIEAEIVGAWCNVIELYVAIGGLYLFHWVVGGVEKLANHILAFHAIDSEHDGGVLVEVFNLQTLFAWTSAGAIDIFEDQRVEL